MIGRSCKDTGRARHSLGSKSKFSVINEPHKLPYHRLRMLPDDDAESLRTDTCREKKSTAFRLVIDCCACCASGCILQRALSPTKYGSYLVACALAATSSSLRTGALCNWKLPLIPTACSDSTQLCARALP